MKLECRLKLAGKLLIALPALLWGVSFPKVMLAGHLEHAERVISLCREATRPSAATYLHLRSRVVSLLRYTLIPGLGGRIFARKLRPVTHMRRCRALGEAVPGRGGSGVGLWGKLAGLGGSDTGLWGK